MFVVTRARIAESPLVSLTTLNGTLNVTRASFFACPASLFVVITSVALCAPPELPDGTDVAIKRIATFKIPEGMQVELFAAEPKLASPVAIGLDERNRLFVAEEYRFNLGTEENRTRPFLLEDDLQLQTLNDRLKMYEKFASKFDGGMDWFRKTADQVRLVEDIDGDGKADRSTVFAPDFNGTLDGLAAGVMATDGDIYFTCIPNLWRLRDTNNDGVADERTIIHTGFGVNAGFLGHDLHGLCWGPDGKLYFSIGDRGFHLQTHEGRTLHGPRNGAVFRCYPDGSELEVVMRGLRNPQEIAFDQFGNLFAADNNCDKGDHSRLVYVLEGADAGWNMAHQSIPDPYLTGTWHAEKMWHLVEGRGLKVEGQEAKDERLPLVPSPPSSGERARVRGPSGENALSKPTAEERTPHPNPLPSKARGEGTGESLQPSTRDPQPSILSTPRGFSLLSANSGRGRRASLTTQGRDCRFDMTTTSFCATTPATAGSNRSD